MVRLASRSLLAAAAVLFLSPAVLGQEVAAQPAGNQTTQQAPPSEAPQPTNQTTTAAPAPTNQTTPTAGPTNQTAGTGGGGQRPSAMSQLEIKPLGNHSWFDPNNNLLHYQQNDYQIVNHSPHEVCNVSLSAPVTAPENTRLQSAYNARVTNSTRTRGIDIFAPMGDTHSIPANGVLNIGYILAHQMASAQENTTAAEVSGPVTIESASYCDEMGGAPAAGGGGAATSGMAGQNATTTTPAQEQPQQPGMNATTPAPANATTPAGGGNTTTTVTPPEQQAGAGSGKTKGGKNKKFKLRHW